MSAPPPRARDAGRQAERTALAWSRTGMAVLVNAVLVLRAGLQQASKPTTGLGVVLLAAAAGVMVYARHRQREFERHSPPPAAPVLALGLMTLVGLATCLAGGLIVVMDWH